MPFTRSRWASSSGEGATGGGSSVLWSSLASAFCWFCEPRPISSVAKNAKPSSTSTEQTMPIRRITEPIAATIGRRPRNLIICMRTYTHG